MAILSFTNQLAWRWERLPFSLRVTVLSVVVFTLWLMVVGHTYGTATVFDYLRGGTADWLVTREAWLGGDPYAPLDQLAEQRLGWLGVRPTEVHPRPPSAFVLLGPLSFIPVGSVTVTLAAAGAVGLALWLAASVRWVGFGPRAEALVIPLALAAPAVYSAMWGSHIPIVAAFLALGLLQRTRLAYRAGGIAFGSGLKLFPFLLAFASKKEGMRTVIMAVSVFMGLTIAGLALPGVDPGEALSAIISAPGNYAISDVSLSLNSVLGWGPGALIFPLIGVMAVVAVSKRLSERGSYAFAAVAMVIFAPYAWPEYIILWLPALLYMWKLGTLPRLAVMGCLVTIALTRDGRFLLAAGLILVGALLMSELSDPLDETPTADLRSSGRAPSVAD